MLTKNNGILATLKAKFQAINPDVLPEGDHIVQIYEMGISHQDSDPGTLLAEAKERGYEDSSFMITVIMGNEKGRIQRKFAISGFERYDQAQANEKYWIGQVSATDLGLTSAAWKKLSAKEKFNAAFSMSSDGKGYLVYNHKEGAFRVTDEKRRDKSIAIFNKFIGGCDPSYQAPQTEDIYEWFGQVCKDMTGKKVGITVKENEDGSIEVISKFRTASV